MSYRAQGFMIMDAFRHICNAKAPGLLFRFATHCTLIPWT